MAKSGGILPSRAGRGWQSPPASDGHFRGEEAEGSSLARRAGRRPEEPPREGRLLGDALRPSRGGHRKRGRCQVERKGLLGKGGRSLRSLLPSPGNPRGASPPLLRGAAFVLGEGPSGLRHPAPEPLGWQRVPVPRDSPQAARRPHSTLERPRHAFEPCSRRQKTPRKFGTSARLWRGPDAVRHPGSSSHASRPGKRRSDSEVWSRERPGLAWLWQGYLPCANVPHCA